ncbi:hypothetical protein M8C21_030713, partial [Ambrosia artemisiifolia]
MLQAMHVTWLSYLRYLRNLGTLTPPMPTLKREAAEAKERGKRRDGVYEHGQSIEWANVGCSSDCRCLGCENKFGKRTDFNVCNETIHETVENEMQSIGSGFPLHEFNNSHYSTPSTPVQQLGHENDPSTTGSYIPSPGSANSNTMLGTSRGDFEMVTSYQQAYLGAFMNQFTPPDTTHFEARHLNSVMNIPPTMDLPNSSTPSGSYFSAINRTGSLMNPVNEFGWPEVMNSNEKPNFGTRLDFTRMNSDSINGGKKPCRCKKSKCLKLYCECFAAGWYCDETCSCQECFNSPDFEDTVEETRKLIESKNPVAFSSKIRSSVESPTSQNV